MNIPDDFKQLLDSVTGKRARFVIDTILEKGSCSTEDLKEAGYEHAPRAARDVREKGIPLETIKVKDSNGKSIAAYVFGDWKEAKQKNALSKTSGRTQLSSKLKEALVERYGCKCHLYGEEYPLRLLQPDHRIPYEIGGDPDDMYDTDYFMLLSPSANRDKSWACEHCSNWSIKDIEFCKKCYYAFPESYEHIAGNKEKRVDISFGNTDMIIYDEIEEISRHESVDVQQTIKRLLSYSLKQKKKNDDNKK